MGIVVIGLKAGGSWCSGTGGLLAFFGLLLTNTPLPKAVDASEYLDPFKRSNVRIMDVQRKDYQHIDTATSGTGGAIGVEVAPGLMLGGGGGGTRTQGAVQTVIYWNLYTDKGIIEISDEVYGDWLNQESQKRYFDRSVRLLLAGGPDRFKL